MENFKSLKVCHVVSVDITAKFLLLPQLKFFQKEGAEVFVVCSQGKWIKDIEKEGIKVKIIEIKRKFFSLLADKIAIIKLLIFFRKEKFQIVHTHTPKAAFLGQIAAKLSGIPVVLNTLHGFYFSDETPFLKRKIFILIEKISALFSDTILSQNKSDIQTAIKEKITRPNKIRFLGNGVDLKKFNPGRFSEEFILKKKQELGLYVGFKVIGIVGRLVREKGYLEIFQAFKKVIEKFPKTLLLIIGPEEPDKKDRLSPCAFKDYGIEKNVVFLGERQDLDEIYPLMDIFVLPSWREGFPRSILEASAMQKPIIATDIRGCREAIEKDKTGILVPLKNPEKLAEAIICLFEDPDKAKEISKNAKEKAEKEFNESLVFDRIIKEYNRLLLKKIKHK